jgi:hypothetical protein
MRFPPRPTFPDNDRRAVLALALFHVVALVLVLLFLLSLSGDLQAYIDNENDQRPDLLVLLIVIVALAAASYVGTRYGVPSSLPRRASARAGLIGRGAKAGALAGVTFVAVAFVLVFAHAVFTLGTSGEVVELLGAFVLYLLISAIATPFFAALGAGIGLGAAIIDLSLVTLVRGNDGDKLDAKAPAA